MDKALLCCKTDTVREVFQKFNDNTKGIVFIVDAQNVLEGVVTEGDVRRALLAGCTLDSVVSSFMNRDFYYVFESEKPEEVFAKFNYRIKVLPIVDNHYHLLDYSEYKKDVRLAIAQPELNGNELSYVMDAVSSTWISSTGKYVTEFEEKFSNWCGVRYGVATSNGTTALHLALTALGIGVNDEVIVPDITFAATINAVLYTGAAPVIVDIEEDGWCIDPAEIEKAITPRTKAIIPVHIYGQPCDMDAVMGIAKRHGLFVVEDCAEAHGAEYAGQKVGSFGDVSCFSFYGNKVLTTGEGGMCITNSSELDIKMRVLRDHGMNKTRRYYHDVIGFNYRMTNLQAAIGVAQLERVEETLQWRDELEEKYRKELGKIKRLHIQRNDLEKRRKIAWIVTAYVDDEIKRDACMEAMSKANIDIRPFFIPLSQMEIYMPYVFSANNSKYIAKRGFNLPTLHAVGDEEIIKIRKILEDVMNNW